MYVSLVHILLIPHRGYVPHFVRGMVGTSLASEQDSGSDCVLCRLKSAKLGPLFLYQPQLRRISVLVPADSLSQLTGICPRGISNS